jgi:Putative transposase
MEPKAVIESLFAAANRTFATLSKRSSLKFGIMMIFQSHGTGMSYKPHLHCVLTAGGIDSNGSWRPYRGINEKLLRAEFQRRMLEQVSKRLAAQIAGRLPQCPLKQWSVYAVYHRENPSALVRYFARTFHGLLIEPKAPLSLDEQTVRFTINHLGRSRTISLSRREFLSRYFAHIPPKGTVTVRHYGLYATRSAAMLKRLSATLEPEVSPECSAEEEEPLHTCPQCHGRMTIAEAFSCDELPLVLRLALRVRGSPLTHGELIQPTFLAV